jgi:hypothetical protein
MWGPYGCINWIEIHRDGGGFILAGEEGIIRNYRLDKKYYVDEMFD